MRDRRLVAATARDLAMAAARGESLAPLLPAVVDALGADAGVGLTRLERTAAGVHVSVEVAGARPLTAEMARLAAEVADRHPALLALSTSCATRVSDVVHLPDFWQTETYRRMHGHSDGRYPMGGMLHRSATTVTFLGAHRGRTDFGPEQVEAFETIQRPLVAAMAFRSALDATTAMLQSEGVAPPSRGGRGADGSGLCGDYRPTRREAEVLGLAAAGWTNVRIARQLGITERTVRKHLGAVYEQSGHHGRAAAAAWWMQRREDS